MKLVAEWHAHYFPDGSVGWEWALDKDGNPQPFGTRLGPQPPNGNGNGCPCPECKRLGLSKAP